MAWLRYTLLRVLLFLGVAALLWIVGIRGVWLVMFAILGSGMISVFALSRSRDAASVVLANRMSTIKSRMAERTAVEDAWDDRQRATTDGGGTGNTVGKEPGMSDDLRDEA
jgi:energy-converting hydrogenase Eha subunit C